MSNNDEWNSVLIPMIRKLAPTLLAEDIVGVQPMPLPPMMMPPWVIAVEYEEVVPTGYVVINANREVSVWIEEQPVHMWKHGNIKNVSGFWDRYIVSEKLITWIKLKWSV